MCVCETCAKLGKDYEIGVSLKPVDAPNEFKTWMICRDHIDGFPFRKECENYEAKTMKLSLVRDTDGKNCTLGKLHINDVFECYSLEDVDRRLESGGVKIYGETAIPRGTYKVVVDRSQRFKRDLPRLLSVPQFEGIRIHPGNTAADTHGCILVGRYRVGDGSISQSVLAFKTLFNKITAAIARGEEVTIEVR